MPLFKATGYRNADHTQRQTTELIFEAADYDAALAHARAASVEWQSLRTSESVSPSEWLIKLDGVPNTAKIFDPPERDEQHRREEQEHGHRIVAVLERWGEFSAALKLADLLVEDQRLFYPDPRDAWRLDDPDWVEIQATLVERHAQWRTALIAKIEGKTA